MKRAQSLTLPINKTLIFILISTAKIKVKIKELKNVKKNVKKHINVNVNIIIDKNKSE